MKRILLVSAMEDEMKYIDDSFRVLISTKNISGEVMIVDKLVTGVGKIKASSALTDAIVSKRYDLIINVGTCGGVSTKTDIMDVVYGSKIKSIDVDYCGGEFDYTLDENFGVDFIRPAVMFSNDKFLTPEYYSTIAVEMNYDADACGMDCAITYDMETFAYATVCDKYNIPFLALRVVTDKPIVPDSYSVFESNIEPGMKKIKSVMSSDEFLEGIYEILACR